MKKIAIGCDHGGLDLKNAVIAHLEEKGYEVKDFGTYTKESCDYPEFAHAVGKSVASGESDQGIVICTTGIGISIAANKVEGIRAALCTNSLMAKMTRLHNDANVLALGAAIVGEGLAMDIVDTFLTTDFSGEERHMRRIRKIEEV
ncbi:ribose 5-phosphate isomerase B [Lachnospiraceae bacterium KH1T2]|nr:ribose 5-phosphate isomerase B [Lachnospiraceae bacterium KH1T2]